MLPRSTIVVMCLIEEDLFAESTGNKFAFRLVQFCELVFEVVWLDDLKTYWGILSQELLNYDVLLLTFRLKVILVISSLLNNVSTHDSTALSDDQEII